MSRDVLGGRHWRGDSVAEIIREGLRNKYRTLLNIEAHREMDYGTEEESCTGEAD